MIINEISSIESQVAKFINKLGDKGGDFEYVKRISKGDINAFLGNMDEDQYGKFIYRADLEPIIFPKPNFKYIITVKNPNEVISRPVSTEIEKLAKRGVLSKDIGLHVAFFKDKDLSLDKFKTLKTDIYSTLYGLDSLKEGENPCWKGYKMVGMKIKNGKRVPNCVTISEINTINKLREGDTEYEKYFKSQLKKTGKHSPTEMSSSEKRDFFNKLDKGWKSNTESTKIKELRETKMKLNSLTLNEQRSIARMVVESNRGLTINEAKYNPRVKREIKLNLEFYSGLKNIAINESKKRRAPLNETMLTDLISFFGNIKDILTASELGKWISEKISNWFKNKFGNTKWGKDSGEIAEKMGKFLKSVTDIIGPRGIAWLIAFYKKVVKNKQKGLPTKEEVDAELSAGEKIFKIILIILICIALYKAFIFFYPLVVGLSGAATPAAAMSSVLNTVVSKAGLTAAFNLTGLAQKVKHLNHKHGDHHPEDENDPEFNDMKKIFTDMVDTAKEELDTAVDQAV